MIENNEDDTEEENRCVEYINIYVYEFIEAFENLGVDEETIVVEIF